MPAKKPKQKPSKPIVKGKCSEEFGGEYFTGEELTAMRRKLRNRDFEIVDLKKIEFSADEDGKKDFAWVLFTDAFDAGFKVIRKAGRRLGQAFGDDMGKWIGRKVEIQVVEYGVGVGADIFPVEDGDDSAHNEDDEGDDDAID